MDINTVKTVYSISFTQEEIRSIVYASIDSMRDEFPELWEIMRKEGNDFVFEVDEPNIWLE